MHISTAFLTTALLALTTASPTAHPSLSPDALSKRATGKCTYRSPNILYMTFNIEINNTQNGGLCGGFWDNINGSGGCGAATRRVCNVDGNRKTISFSVPHSCPVGDIQWIIRAATDPQVNGVECVNVT